MISLICVSTLGCGSGATTTPGPDYLKTASRSLELPEEYTDSQYAFSFKYPENWNIMENAMGARVIVLDTREDFAPNMNIVVMPKDPSLRKVKKEGMENELKKSFDDLKVVKFENNGFFDAKDCIHLIYTGGMGEAKEMEWKQYMFHHKNNLLVVTFTCKQAQVSEMTPAFESILSSFEFQD